ncbi:MAG: hypothetical protein GC151_10065 [Betaproteobacteria bacterium]|nr:hypothetical protein [Betaproteobacteria bacterium]
MPFEARAPGAAVTRRSRRVARALAPFFLVAGSAAAVAGDFYANPDDYLGRVQALQPGDTLHLGPGDYRDGLRLHDLVGRPDAPIRIVALSATDRPRFIAQRGRNTVSLSNVAYILIRDLDLEGRRVPVDAVKAEGTSRFAHHVTLEGLRIRGYDADQQNVAISTKCPAWGWVIRDNDIAGAGTGLYLGNSDGTAPFWNGVVERNSVRDTIGYNLQVKHQSARPDIGGPAVTIIRYNVFSKASGGSRGSAARPNVLVDAQPPAGPGSTDRFLVYGNFFYRNPTEALFQGEGNLALYNNILVNPDGDAVIIQPHHGRPADVEVVGNSVVARDVGILLHGGDPRRDQRIAGNAVFAGSPMKTGLDTRNNVVGPERDATEYFVRPFGEPDGLDLSPTASLVSKSRTIEWRDPPFADGRVDIARHPRSDRVAGALAHPSRDVLQRLGVESR